jgi:hypothetical protein
MSSFRQASIVFVGGLLAIVLVAPGIGLAQPEKPSFNCRKARTLDERAICHDSRLAELDQAASIDYSLATHYQGDGADVFRDEAQKAAKETLEARHACGADQLCILDQQVLLIESLLEDGSGPPISSSTVGVPLWVGSYRLKLFAARSQPPSKGLPLRVGECTVTKIASVGASAEHDPESQYGYADIAYENQGRQVSGYTYNEAVAKSRVGDEVLLCLVSIPKNCPPGDDRGKVYSGTNFRTGAYWLLPDSKHTCGGA